MAVSAIRAAFPRGVKKVWETVTAKKLLMKPFVKAYLKKQQAQYVPDLKKGLLTRIL